MSFLSMLNMNKMILNRKKNQPLKILDKKLKEIIVLKKNYNIFLGFFEKVI